MSPHRLPAQRFDKAERRQLYGELKGSIDLLEPIDGKPLEEVVMIILTLNFQLNVLKGLQL